MRTRIVVAVLCVAQFVVTLDVTIVAIALPAIGRDLHAGPGLLQWVIGLYTLVFGGLLVMAGRLADRLGQRRMFVAGMAIFVLASLGCGLAPSMSVLLLARAMQGAGAAALAPAALALLTAVSPGGRALGLWTAASAGGGAGGWVLGGILAGGPGWPWVFLVNVPIGALAIATGIACLPATAGTSGGSGIGLVGMMAATVGIGVMLFGLTALGERAHPLSWIAVITGGVLLAGTRLVGTRNLLWRQPGFVTANGVALTLTAVTTAPIFLCVLDVSATLPPLQSGLIFAPFNLAVIAGSLLGARLVRRRSTRSLMAAGLFVIALATIVVAATLWCRDAFPASTPALALSPALIVDGVGLGVASVASTTAGITAVPAAERGVAAGVLTAAAQVGSSVGLGALVSLTGLLGSVFPMLPATTVVVMIGALVPVFVILSRLRPPTCRTR